MNEKKSEILDIRSIFSNYVKHWPWFAISVGICLCLGIFMAYIQKPKNEVRASVILSGDNSVGKYLGGGLSGVAQIFGGNASAADEVSIMTSHSNLRQVAMNLGLDNTLYERKMPLIYEQITKEKPLLVVPDENTILTDTLRTSLTFKITLNGKDRAKKILVQAKGKDIVKETNVALPATVKTEYGDFTVMTTPYYTEESANRYRVSIKSPDIAAEDLREETLNISLATKTSSIIELQMIAPDEELAKNILDDIIDVYNARSQKEQMQESGATATFLQDRLQTVRDNLASTEKDLEAYKEQAGLGMIEADGKSMYERLGETEKLLTQQQAQTEITRIALDLAKESAKDNSTIPPLTDNDAVNALISSYNSYVLQRMQLASAVKPDNQTLERIDAKIATIRTTMIKTLEDAYASSKSMEAELQRVQKKADSQIKQLPSVENSFRKIARNQEIEEQIYIFLLQKQEEIQVLFNDERPKARIIDRAYATGEDNAIGKKSLLLLCIILGLVIPPAVIFIKDFILSNKNGQE